MPFNITTPDLLGHLFYIIILIGTRLLHRKNNIGWLLRVCGDVGWVGVGLALGLTSVILWSSVFALNDAWGYYKWSNLQRQNLTK